MHAGRDIGFEVGGTVVDQRRTRLQARMIDVVGFTVEGTKHVKAVALVIEPLGARAHLIHGVAALDFGREGLEGIDVKAGPRTGLGNQVADRNNAFTTTATDADDQIVLG